MFIVNRRVLEIFVILIFGFTAMSTLIGTENVAGGSIVKLGFPFAFYEQVCSGTQCTYNAIPLMLIPDALISFGIAAGFVNFKDFRKQKKLSSTGTLIANKQKKPVLGILKKKQDNKQKKPTFFDIDSSKRADEPAAQKQEFEYKPSKYDIADEEPLFTEEELRDENK